MTLVGRSLAQAAGMLWVTLWPLVLGFLLSGVVQAYVSRERMQRSLGDHRPAAVARASAYGAASSSCSYAASAMGKSLFARGADFVTSIVFTFASTNLVIEMAIIVVALMGWQFAAGEAFGGVVMIVLLALLGGLWFRGRQLERARERLTEGDRGDGDSASPGRSGRWRDAAAYTVADLRMVRRELLIGFLIGGAIAAAVPIGFTRAVFWQGHGALTVVWDAAVAPAVALVSCVCSIGNVPIAAALWRGGISFSGVVTFLFADLVALPILLIYRRYYGTRVMWRMLALFWVVMATAGVVTQVVFGAAGLVPTDRDVTIPSISVGWNLTSVLDFLALALLAVVWVAARRAPRAADAARATDPVCGMVVEVATAPATEESDGRTVHFCSDRCRDRFVADRGSATVAGNATPGARPAGLRVDQ